MADVSNCWFSWVNWLLGEATEITADAEAGDLVIDNIIERQGYKLWRTDGLSEGSTAAGFTVDFGQARTLQALALYFPRQDDPEAFDEPAAFASTDTVRHRLSALTEGGDEVYDSGVVQSGVNGDYGYHVILLNAPVSARYWRVDLNAISRAALGYVDVACAWAGPAFIPRIGFSWGDTYGWDSNATISEATRGLADFTDSVPGKRYWSFSLDGLSDAEKLELIDFERRMTKAGRFLVVRNDVPAGMGEMFARQQSSLGLSSLAMARNSKSFRLVESL
jgi:hypothetical protein